MNRLEPKYGEDDRASVDGSEGVASGDDDDVLDAVLGRVVVAAKADDGAKSEAKGVKDLGGGCADMNFFLFASSYPPSFSISSGNKNTRRKSNHSRNLIGGIQPDCGEQKLVHLGSEHVGEPLRCTVQRDPPEEEDGQDEVGEKGREVNNLDKSHLSFLLNMYNYGYES